MNSKNQRTSAGVSTDGTQTLLLVSSEEWSQVKALLHTIAERLKETTKPAQPALGVKSPYITAKEFMAAVRICRSSFDKLVQQNKLMTLKKGRKVYVVATEVSRYFAEVQL